MEAKSHRKLISFLPLVLVATFAVVIAPVLLVSWLRESGVITAFWTAMATGVTLSLAISQVAAAVWKRTGSDVLFSELMLWGWVRRWRAERRIGAAADLLGLTGGRPKAIAGAILTLDQTTSLLTQLTSSLEARDQYTHGHSRRVARHAANIAREMGLSRERVAKIRAAGAMHDVGKVETPIPVLHKEGKLTDEEYAIVRRHPVDGAVMVAALHDEELTAMVRHHHERMDGTGYPDALSGEEIPLGARILAVADTFDAITSTRPYRHALAHKTALDILSAEAGTQLDRGAVRAFCRCYAGRKPLAAWTILVNARPRLASLLGEGLSPANVASVMATAATATTVGAAAVGSMATASADSERRYNPQAEAAAKAVQPAPATRTPTRGLIPGMSLMAYFSRPADAVPPPAGESSKRAGRSTFVTANAAHRSGRATPSSESAAGFGQDTAHDGGRDANGGVTDVKTIGSGKAKGRGKPKRDSDSGRGNPKPVLPVNPKRNGNGKGPGQGQGRGRGLGPGLDTVEHVKDPVREIHNLELPQVPKPGDQ